MEKRIPSLVGMIVEGEHMVFPQIRETFYSAGVEHDNIRPSGTAILEKFEKLYVNFIEGMEVKSKDVRAMVRLMSPKAALRNWTATTILTIFLLS